MVNTAKVPPGASVAVVGLGGVGLCSILGAIASGARQIIAVDLSDEKLEFARQLGATHTVNARSPDAAREIKDLSGGGVDFFFEMAGAVPALELAYAATARGGTTVAIVRSAPVRITALEIVSAETWSESPILSAETSSSTRSGMCSGSTSISTSRVT